MTQPLQTFHVDSRLPVSPEIDSSDPGHPKNITKTALMIQNQATADTKYDIYPPTRIEGFLSTLPLPTKKYMTTIVLCTSVITIIVSISLLMYTSNKIHRIFFIVAAILGIHYAVLSIEKVTVYRLSE
jgi:hypothetical protein